MIAIDESGSERVLRLDRLAGYAHLDRFLETDQTRQTLRALRARDDAEVRLGQSHLPVGDATR